MLLILLDILIISKNYFQLLTSWYCNIFDKVINIKSRSEHNNSNSHKHKEKYGVGVKKCEFFRPDNNKMEY